MKSKICLGFLIVIGIAHNATSVHSQTYQPSNRIPVADGTLGTQVSGSNSNFAVTGGLSRGQNIFHSFTDFSVPSNGLVTFTNPVGNQSIITRVTGNLFSDINGKIDTNGANLFLINPNGIVFGNVQLNVGKAFVGSTANGINLVDAQGKNYIFSTKNINDMPLITVNPNVFLNVSSLSMGTISSSDVGIKNYGLLQTNNDSQYIGLIGGNVTLDGGFGGRIIAPGGRVDLGGSNTAGIISIDDKGLVYTGSNISRSDVSLINGASVSVNANEVLVPVNTFLNNAKSTGGTINVSANNVKIINDLSVTASNGEPASFKTGLSVNSGKKNTSSGDINIDTTGKVSLNNGNISNIAESGSEGNIGSINITAKELILGENSFINSTIYGKGNSGDTNIKAAENVILNGGKDGLYNGITILNSAITSNLFGEGDTGKISIQAQGNLSLLNNSVISTQVAFQAVGNSKGISIAARNLDLRNGSGIQADTFGKGNAGDINVDTTENITIAGKDSFFGFNSTDSNRVTLIDVYKNNLAISSDTFGTGNTGKISINTQGKISIIADPFSFGVLPNLNHFGSISGQVRPGATGNSQGINITAKELELRNGHDIISSTGGKGNAGDINIKTTGDIVVVGDNVFNPSIIRNDYTGSSIATDTYGSGNTGKLSIETQGHISLLNRGYISSRVQFGATGNSQGINIVSRTIDVRNASNIGTDTVGKGNAGNINIKTTGDITVAGCEQEICGTAQITSNLLSISSATFSSGDTGKISINAQGNLFLTNQGYISSEVGNSATGNSHGIDIHAQTVGLYNQGYIFSRSLGKGTAGNIDIKTIGGLDVVDSSYILASNLCGTPGQEQTGNISIASDKVYLNNSRIAAESDSLNGGNITMNIRDQLLIRDRSWMQPDSAISTNSTSNQTNGNGGNISINSPLIIAAPGNSDISANAAAGSGGKVNITSKGLFGIRFSPKGQDSPLSNDITASSTFGQNGIVNINTPGIDPGKDANQLPTVPTDASNQISQTCSPSNRESRFAVTGRGGLPKNAYSLLTSDAVWQDSRTVNQPTASNSNIQPTKKLLPPAIGWVFNGKGRVTLIAADSSGQQTGTRVVCPNAGEK
jgi:filamentous hemagglutinin family protein